MGEVSLIDVSKRFALRIDGNVQTVRALDRLSFTVRDGEVVALIGPSGCGKTTALRIAMGLETATQRRGDRRRRHRQRLRLRPRHGVPACRIAAVAQRLAERGVRPGNEGHARRGAARHRDEISDAGRSCRQRQTAALSIVRRHAAARRHRARARDRSESAVDGRAVRRARCADARGFAGRAVGHPRPHQKDHPVRHPRSRRSGAARRPRRGDAARPPAGNRRPCRCRVRATISPKSAARTQFAQTRYHIWRRCMPARRRCIERRGMVDLVDRQQPQG